MEPATIAAQLRELAIYYELDGDRHRARAYDGAARSVEAATGLHKLIDDGRLEELPGIGPSTARVIAELARRGTVTVLERMRAQWPAVVIELSQLPKIGVPKARKLFESLAPADLDAVAAACRAGTVRALPGFGKASEAAILASIENRHARGTQQLLVDAEEPAAALAGYLRAAPAAIAVELAGPVRRWCEIIEHLAYAVATRDRDAVFAHAAAYALVTSLARPATPHEPAIAQLASGQRVLIYAAPPARFGWAQIVATGSPEHVAQLRARAADRGIDPDNLEAVDEPAAYAALGLPFLPPEVRDGTDELAAADAGDDFRDLIELPDLTTACHCHTTYSDGRASIAEMAAAAAERGFAAITITDHSAAAGYAGGLDLARLREQHAEIAQLTAPPAAILRGTEADILETGAIDVPPEILGELDLVIASVHQRYKLDPTRMTERLLTAMRAPIFKIWGHALGRLVMRREPIAIDLPAVLDAVAESRAAIEINGDPYRLDLDPVNARAAVRRGIKFVLSSDAHSTRGLGAARYAVHMARRARIRKRDVLNARPPEEFAAAVKPVATS